MGEVKESRPTASSRKRSGEAGVTPRIKTVPSEARGVATKSVAQARLKKEREMTALADPLADLLFGQERTLVNFKLLRGDDPQVSESELRAEAHSALVQVFLENCDTFPDFPEDRSAKRINVDNLVNI